MSPQSLSARVLHSCCRWLSLGRNVIHGEVALCDGSTAMMVFGDRRYGEVTEDEDAESEGCPRYCLPSWPSAEKRNEVPDRRADILTSGVLRDVPTRPAVYLANRFGILICWDASLVLVGLECPRISRLHASSVRKCPQH